MLNHAQTAPPLDLTTCDREPIHLSGAIQPHGLLLVASWPDGRIEAASANIETATGIAPRDVLGRPLDSMIDAATTAALRVTSAGPQRLLTAGWAATPGIGFRAVATVTGARLLFEAEPARAEELTAAALFSLFDAAAAALRAAPDPATLATRLCEGVARLTGYDRVKVYRFAPDDSGEVIGECNNGHLPSYLGLHFPASDIPAQARALYTRNLVRQIPDIHYTPVPLLQTGTAPIDLSDAGLRAVSPVHLEYLRNMDVAASMSVSILRGDRLWGLVACHHHAPLQLAPERLQACVTLAQLAAWEFTVIEEARASRRVIELREIEGRLLQQTTAGTDYREAVLRESTLLLQLLAASGFALVHGATVTTVGDTPDETGITALADWLVTLGPELFATDHLAAHYAPAEHWTDAAGLLAVPLGGAAPSMLLWFRPPIARTITWGGDPTKPVTPAPGDRLVPRLSFTTWVQDVRDRARPWRSDELLAAQGLRDVIVDIILRRSLELEQLNAELHRTNEELEAFAYVASHDLNEPLRQIETFSTLLERIFHAESISSTDASRWFAGLQSSSRGLRTLIKDLSEFSRLNRHAKPLTPTDLNELLDEARADLGSAIAETGTAIEAASLPMLVCDRVQLRQVFENIIMNAIKYRDPARPPVIRITHRVSEETARSVPGLKLLEISFADNGIGFDEQYRERIFEPFHRLHSSEKYPGSGIGLAICRKIVERHGGTIRASGRPGRGATFALLLPIRPTPGNIRAS